MGPGPGPLLIATGTSTQSWGFDPHLSSLTNKVLSFGNFTTEISGISGISGINKHGHVGHLKSEAVHWC